MSWVLTAEGQWSAAAHPCVVWLLAARCVLEWSLGGMGGNISAMFILAI